MCPSPCQALSLPWSMSRSSLPIPWPLSPSSKMAVASQRINWNVVLNENVWFLAKFMLFVVLWNQVNTLRLSKMANILQKTFSNAFYGKKIIVFFKFVPGGPIDSDSMLVWAVIGAIRQAVITWTNIDQDPQWHMALLCLNELTHWPLGDFNLILGG